MYQRIAVLLALACAPLARADVVELSPDLYLVIRMSREDVIAVKIGAIKEANEYAASVGRVAVPVVGRLTWFGPVLKEYEYQFRLMSRAQALAARPTLADVVVAVDGPNTCGSPASPTVATLFPELSKLEPLSGLNVLAARESKKKWDEPVGPVPEVSPLRPTSSAHPSAQ